MPRSGFDSARLLPSISLAVPLIVVASAQARPTACFDISPPSPVQVGQSVTFDASCSSDDDPARSLTSYEWDFEGDGIFEASGISVEHAYPAPGQYIPHLRVQNDIAQADYTSAALEVVGLEACLVVVPNPTPVGGTVTFDATCSTGDIIGAVVNPGDGPEFPLAELTATYVYDTPGSYTARLTVADGDGHSDQWAVEVVVTPDPAVACFTISPNPVAVGGTVELDGSCSSGSPPLDLTWDLDADGAYDDAAGAIHSTSFPTTGSYDVGLRVWQPHFGIADDLRAIVHVVDGECVVDSECPDDGLACTVPFCDAGLCAIATLEPGAPCDDGDPCTMDETCDGAAVCAGGVLTDEDEDGYVRAGCEDGTDCDDLDPNVNPGMAEIPGDGVDNDCDPATPGCGAERLGPNR